MADGLAISNQLAVELGAWLGMAEPTTMLDALVSAINAEGGGAFPTHVAPNTEVVVDSSQETPAKILQKPISRNGWGEGTRGQGDANKTER